MDLSILGEESDINEHQIAWMEQDWDKVKELASQFKKAADESLWEILNNVTKKSGYKTASYFESYDQRAINHALSQHVSMVGYAAELNQMEGLISDEMHYDYLYYCMHQVSLPRVKFAKLTDDWHDRAIIRAIAKVYNCSIEKATFYRDEMLSGNELNHIKKLIGPTVISADDDFLKFIPTKADRTAVFKQIQAW